TGSQDTNVSSQTNQEAIYLAQQQLEYARASLRSNFSSTPLASSPTSGYTNNLNIVTSADGLTKTITSLVSWAGKQVALSTTVTDWQAALSAVCGSSLTSGDWTNPYILNPSHGVDVSPATFTGLA